MTFYAFTQCSVMHKLTVSRATSFPGSLARPRGGGVKQETLGTRLFRKYLEIRRLTEIHFSIVVFLDIDVTVANSLGSLS